MNREHRRKQSRRKAMLLSATLTTGAFVGYTGYMRISPAFASSSCVVTSSANGTGAGTLGACIADVGVSSITFDPALSKITLGTGDGPFTINRSLTIDGYSTASGTRSARMEIDGAGTEQIFYAQTGTLTLKGLSLTNGYVQGNGGAVKAKASSGDVDVVLDGVSITETRAENPSASVGSDGGMVYADGDVTVQKTGTYANYFYDSRSEHNAHEGGGIFALGDVSVEDATFKSLSTTVVLVGMKNPDGGAIHAANVTIGPGSVFENNYANRGGDISATSSLSITGATFTNSKARRSGGSAYVTGDVTIDSSTFTSTESLGGDGGAIKANGDVKVYGDSSFTDSRGEDGGAIQANGDVTVYGPASFTGNTATSVTAKGGAIQANSVVIIGNSTFTNNASQDHGGAIHADTQVKLFYSPDFIDNSADDRGGAIYSEGTANVYGTANFEGNMAVSRGGAIYSRSDLSVSGAATFTANGKGLNFVGNQASTRRGGAIYVQKLFTPEGPSLNITAAAKFENNYANNGGGAVYAHQVYINATDVEFRGNSAVVDGGAINARYDIALTGNTLFANNRANSGLGGAIYSYFGSVSTTSDASNPARFEENYSLRRGGAIYAYYDVSAINAVFRDNTTYLDADTTDVGEHTGGAISVYANSSEVYVSGSVFSGNKASFGGAIGAPNGNVTAINSSFDSNQAEIEGGAIRSSGTTSIIASSFDSNTAKGEGGAILGVGQIEIGSSVFDSNAAGNSSIGGAIKAEANISVDNSTFYKNSAKTGSAIYSAGAADLDFVTVYKNYVYNYASSADAAISVVDAQVDNSVIAGNTSFGSNSDLDIFAGNTANLDSVLLSSDGSALNGANVINNQNSGSNIIFGQPNFAEMADNGGGSKTLMPKYQSPVIDAANPSFTQPAGGEDNRFDQRGELRVFGSAADLGAVEVQSVLTAPEFTITVSAGAGGSISPSGDQTLAEMASQTFVVTPDSGFQIASVTIDGVNQTISDTQSFSFSFDDVTQDHSIAASFEQIPEESASAPAPVASAPAPPAQPSLLIAGELQVSVGEQITAEIRNWDESAKIFIGENEAKISALSSEQVTFEVPDLQPGSYQIVVESNLGKLTVSADLVVEQTIAAEQTEFQAWTKKLNDNQVKVYAKNPVGQGKVQFFVDGEEIAWVRAESAEDPKLREAQGRQYLVRTVDLQPGKQAIEVYLNGERVWRAAYTAN